MHLKNPTIISGRFSRLVIYTLLVIAAIFYLNKYPLFASANNNFDLSNSLVPADEIYHGGPPRDGIPAINKPVFVTRSSAAFLNDSDQVLGIHYNGIAKAYPIKILNYHEIVNDWFADTPIVVTYCPLCGSGIAFLSRHQNQTLRFGVSGLLYNSDMLLYDRQSESLWSQILGKAISGPMRGEALKRIAMSNTSWQEWRQRHPDTLLLSTQTGYYRNYQRNPYPAYAESDSLYFPIKNLDRRYHPKEQVLGLEIDKVFKAYPFSELSRAKMPLQDTLNDKQVTVIYNQQARSAQVVDKDGSEIPTIVAYWFAWMAFHPESLVYSFNN